MCSAGFSMIGCGKETSQDAHESWTEHKGEEMKGAWGEEKQKLILILMVILNSN